MSEEQQAAFLIDGVAYPMPTRFRLADPVVVEEITGLVWDDFEGRYRDLIAARARGEEAHDLGVVVGLIAVAVWQRNPSWKRERVIRFVEQVDMASLDSVGPVQAAAEVVQVPPADGGAPESQNGSASSSDDDSDLVVTTQPVPGLPLSAASTG